MCWRGRGLSIDRFIMRPGASCYRAGMARHGHGLTLCTGTLCHRLGLGRDRHCMCWAWLGLVLGISPIMGFMLTRRINSDLARAGHGLCPSTGTGLALCAQGRLTGTGWAGIEHGRDWHWLGTGTPWARPCQTGWGWGWYGSHGAGAGHAMPWDGLGMARAGHGMGL
jgi:hypothetical protein